MAEELRYWCLHWDPSNNNLCTDYRVMSDKELRLIEWMRTRKLKIHTELYIDGTELYE